MVVYYFSLNVVNLAEARCKNDYQLFTNHIPIAPSGVKKWKSKFPEKLGDWTRFFQDIYIASLRTIYHLAEDNKCIDCFNADFNRTYVY